jgi:hypothetical protein
VIASLLRRLGTALEPPESLPRDVALVRNAWITAVSGRLAGMSGPAAAVTIGNTILVHPHTQPTPRLLRHELAHVRQWQARPLTFPLRYLWCHVRHGYRDNPYEVEARLAETDGGIPE